jgi:DNA-binding transcriptional ArsR family regulator
MTSYDALAVRFKALAHPVRLQILGMLRRGEACVCHMETALDKRQAYISQQLMVLRDAGLVDARKDGLQVFYCLADDITAALLDAIFEPVVETKQARLEDCTCPHCVIAVENISSNINEVEHADSQNSGIRVP